jgi:D-serine deaminase-like pyridoxal phosphate-dependent protein
MEKETIALATKLLVKAQGTNFDAEAAALTVKAYRLLAEALNAYDDSAVSPGTARKRERRHLRDRRSNSESPASSVSRGSTSSHHRNHDWVDLAPRGRVDLRI